MLEVLEFVFGSFWRWLGCFLMLTVVCQAVYGTVAILFGRKP